MYPTYSLQDILNKGKKTSETSETPADVNSGAVSAVSIKPKNTKITLITQKYSNDELASIATNWTTDANLNDKLKYLGYTDDEIATYGTRWNLTDRSENSIKNRTNSTDNFYGYLTLKYNTAPAYNVLSYGGEFETYDNLINEILVNGNKDGRYNSQIETAKTAIGDMAYTESSVSKNVADMSAKYTKVQREYLAFLDSLYYNDTPTTGKRFEYGLQGLVYSTAGSLLYLTDTIKQGIENIKNGTNEKVSASANSSGLLRTAENYVAYSEKGMTGTQTFFWELAGSVLQNVMSFAASGGNAFLVGLIQGSTVAGQAMYDASEKGGDFWTSTLSGAAQGVAEGLFEWLSVGKIIKMSNYAGAKSLVKNIAKSFAIEGSEEAFTEVADILIDWAALGNKSDIGMYMKQYESASADSESNEVGYVLGQVAMRVLKAGIAGGLSGVALGGGSMVANKNNFTGTKSFNNELARNEFMQNIAKADEEMQRLGKVSKSTQNALSEASKYLDYSASNLSNEDIKAFNDALGKNTLGKADLVSLSNIYDSSYFVTDKTDKKYSVVQQAEAIKQGIKSNTFSNYEAYEYGNFAKATKIDVAFYAGGVSENGYFDASTNTVYVNTLNKNAVYSLASHEALHYIKANNETKYNSLTKVFDDLRNKNKTYSRIFDDAVKLYSTDEKTKSMGESVWQEEGYAAIAGALINEQAFGEILSSGDTSLGKRILSFFKGLSRHIKGKGLSEAEKSVQRATEALTKSIEDNSKQTVENVGKNGQSAVRYSIGERDSEGRQLSAQQQEFFKDSKVVDKDGNLLVVYHGTQNNFNIFNREKIGSQTDDGIYGKGFYFSSLKVQSEQYGKVREYYLKLANPLILSNYNNIEKVADLLNMSESCFSVENGFNKTIIRPIYSFVQQFTTHVVEAGFAGVMVDYGTADEIVVFSPNQIKLTTNLNPTENEDIRYSLNEKKYTRADAKKALDGIIEKLYVATDKNGNVDGRLENKSKNEVLEKLYKSLNERPEGFRGEGAMEIADFIINNATVEDLYEDEKNYDNIHKVETLKKYLKNIKLNAIQDEIKHHFDTRAGLINAMWGAKNGEGVGADSIAMELEEEGIKIDSTNEADIFINMVETYETARDTLKKEAAEKLNSVLSKDERASMRASIIRDVLTAYDKFGSDTAVYKQLQKYENRISELKFLLKESKEYNIYTNRILNKRVQLLSYKKGDYISSTILSNDKFADWIKYVSAIGKNFSINATTAKDKIKSLSELFKRDNLSDAGMFANEKGEFPYVIEKGLVGIDYLKEYDSRKHLDKNHFTLDEIKALYNVVAATYSLVVNYDAVFIKDKKENVNEWVERAVAEQKDIGHYNPEDPKSRKKMSPLTLSVAVLGDPSAYFTLLDGGNRNGIFNAFNGMLKDGETSFYRTLHNLNHDISAFLKENKGYMRKTRNTAITVQGAVITKAEAIYDYMLFDRNGVAEDIAQNGFNYHEFDKTQIRERKRVSNELSYNKSFNMSAAKEEIRSQLSDTDLQYIKLMKEFWKTAGEVKADTDVKRWGDSRVVKGEYVPMIRNMDLKADSYGERAWRTLDRMHEYGWTKTQTGTSQIALCGANIFDVSEWYAKQVSTYAGYAVAMDSINRIMQTSYLNEDGSKITLKAIMSSYANGHKSGNAYTYMYDMFNKILGKRVTDEATSQEFNVGIDKLRGTIAIAALSANIKVVMTQPVSYFSALPYIDAKNLIRGISGTFSRSNYKTMDEYSPLAAERHETYGVVKAEAVVNDALKGVQRFFAAPMEYTDRATLGTLFTAAQYQAKDNGSGEIGTNENLIAATIIFEEAVRETQSNSFIGEKSALQRSEHFIAKSITMFTSENIKRFSRLVEFGSNLEYLSKKIKNGDDSTNTAKEYSDAKIRFGKAVAGQFISNALFALVCVFTNWLFKKDDEDEEGYTKDFADWSKDWAIKFGWSCVNMLPLVEDIVTYFAQGYEIDDMVLSGLDDLLSAVKKWGTLIGKSLSGEGVQQYEIMSAFKNTAFIIGAFTGMPLRNLHNQLYGLVDRFDPSAAYKYKNLFYDLSYTSDYKKAIKNGDYELAATILELELKEKGIGATSDDAENAVDLAKSGIDIDFEEVDTIAYGDDEYTLTNEEKNIYYKTVYFDRNEQIKAVQSTAVYGQLTQEEVLSAITSLTSYMKRVAKSKILSARGIETSDLTLRDELESLNLSIAEYYVLAAAYKGQTTLLIRYSMEARGYTDKQIDYIVQHIR